MYPDRELERLYLDNQSVWEEAAAGETTIPAALEYMQVDPNDQELVDAVTTHLRNGTNPL